MLDTNNISTIFEGHIWKIDQNTNKNMANKTMRKVIIDTDPGIDDAMALMMALQAHDRGKQST